MNTTVISGRLVRNPGYNEVENEKGLHKIAKFVLAVRSRFFIQTILRIFFQVTAARSP